MPTSKYIIGVSLIEALLALSLSFVIMGSVLQLYLISEKTTRLRYAVFLQQESNFIATTVLMRCLRMATAIDVRPDRDSINNSDSITLNQQTFFVGLTGRRDAQGKAIAALYMRDHQGDAHEVLTPMDRLQLRYDLQQNDHLVRVSSVDLASASKVRGIAVTLINAENQVNFYVARRQS